MYSNIDSLKDKYKLYQKEGQVVSIRSTDSQLFVSVPHLSANFQNIQMNEQQDMFYQLKSFYCTNTFPTINNPEVIYIDIHLQWLPLSMTANELEIQQPDDVFVTNQGGAFPITISREISFGDIDENSLIPPQAMSAAEIVANINLRFEERRAALLNTSYNSFLALSPENIQFMYFMQNYTLGLSSGGKLQLQTDSSKFGTNVTSANFPSIPADGRRYILVGCLFEIQSNSGETIEVQEKQRKLFGMVPYDFDPLVQIPPRPLYHASITLVYSPNTRGLLLYYITAFYKANKAAIDYDIAGKAGWPRYVFAVINDPQLDPQNPLTVTGVAQYPMNVLINSHVYIRTSLNTNFWDEKGTAQDIMEIIPLTTGLTELGAEYRQITRIYQVKDPNVKTFSIRLTDENNKLLTFKDPYILQLAVFFKN